ncbi:MAG: transcriptional activator domain [Solirubrobacterales bacterium]|jgi:WD40 repeat protein/DNA-binding SARP family transcriptional activator|nr:transcriptional activator domain [Solirubrobacterales bacterium]
MTFEVRLLGSVEALVDGHSLALGGSKQRGVVAMLALRANTTLSGDELIDGLWGDDLPASATKNLHVYVSRLRKALGESGAEAEILTRGRGYELRLPADAVDALRFERLVEEAAREPPGAGANGLAGEALSLWRGAPLADVASEPFAGPEIARLEELYLRALELAIDAELATGRHAEVIARLEALIAEEPLRERLHGQRMLALYRDGRQSEALDAYREARETLIEQIGVEPGPELKRLQEQILAQDPALDAPPPIVELPVQLEGGSPLLAGRERELGWLRRRWARAREGRIVCVMVWGPAGIGKTRLVAELAAEVQREGAAVLYAGGGEVSEVALATVAEAGRGHRPTLLVLDYADDTPPSVLEAAAALARAPEGRPLMVCALHHDEQGPPAFAPLLESGAAQRLRLDPLGEVAAAEIAQLYTTEGVTIPLRTLLAESEGLPLRIHRAAGEWARAEAAERLAATAGRAADDQTELRSAQAAVAGGVIDFQTATERTCLYAVEEPPDPSEPEICPFRGLAPFDAAHAEYFFGRERLVAELIAHLVGSTLLAVVGPSGSGKSSAVRAGLLPALADGVVPGSEAWRRAVMRPGARPLAELSRTLARAVPEAAGEDPAPWIADALDRLPDGEPLVLVIDQFEEAFVACRDPAEREAFFDALVEGAGDPEKRIVVVLAIRADFYARCAEHPELSTLVSANQVLVGPMRRDELRRAIELPARRAGLRAEPRLVSALVGDVASEPGGLPLLSAALLELWQRRDGRTLRYAAYEHSGGVEGAVARLAEGAYQRLAEAEQRRARPMLLRLAGADEGEAESFVRRRVSFDELELERDPDGARALSVLTEARLLTADEDTVEVAHEALLREWPRLRGWLEADAEGRRLHQHLIGAAREWRDSDRDPAELYRGARLAAAQDWAAEHEPELNELEREFLDQSQAASEREAERQRRANRRLRTLLAGVGVMLAAAVVAGVIAISERGSARRAATAEAAQRLGAQAVNEDILDRAVRLAGAGVALDDSMATRSNLLTVLLRTPPALLGVLSGTGDQVIYAVAASPDGRLLALGDSAGTVTIFDASTRRRLGEYQLGDRRFGGLVQTLTFSLDGSTLAVTGQENTDEPPPTLLHLIDPRTQERRARVVLPPFSDPPVFNFASVAFPPTGHDLVVIQAPDHGPSVLQTVNVRTGEIEGRPRRVDHAGFFGLFPAADGRRVFVTSAHNDETWEVDSRTLRVVRRHPFGDEVGALSPDGSVFALGSPDGTVRLVDRRSGATRRLTGRHPGGVLRLAFSPDGRKLVSSGGEKGAVIVWDVARGEISEELSGHRGEVWGLAVSPDGRTLYSGAYDGQAILWDLSGDRRLLRYFPVDPPFRVPDTPRGLAPSPDGETLALTHSDGAVDLIDTRTLRRRDSLPALEGFAAAVAFSPDGPLLAVAGERGQVTLWNARTLAPAGELRGLRANSQALTFSPDGKLLASAENEGELPRLRIWNVRRRALTAFRSQTLAVSLAFSPDGNLIAAAALDRGTEIRDARSAQLVKRLPTPELSRSVAFSPDGSLLAVGQYDGTGRLYSTESWEPVGRPLQGHTQRITYVDFSADGRTLATASADGTVGLWDVGTQHPIGSPLTLQPNTFASAALSPDGSRLFAVSTRGPGLSFDTAPEAWKRQACAVMGGGLTPEQWEEVVPEQDYISVCPSG